MLSPQNIINIVVTVLTVAGVVVMVIFREEIDNLYNKRIEKRIEKRRNAIDIEDEESWKDYPSCGPLPINDEMVERSMLEAAAERLIGVCSIFNPVLKNQTAAEREIEVGKIGFELKDNHGREFLGKVIAILEVESPHTQLVVVDTWKNLSLLD